MDEIKKETYKYFVGQIAIDIRGDWIFPDDEDNGFKIDERPDVIEELLREIGDKELIKNAKKTELDYYKYRDGRYYRCYFRLYGYKPKDIDKVLLNELVEKYKKIFSCQDEICKYYE